ncbi:MAG: CAMP factor family pore-forming toxin, partial [Bowdeniella nasicola]|nr:CAMP factor family pore-forming toxin [Bowdeniella nasicola]
ATAVLPGLFLAPAVIAMPAASATETPAAVASSDADDQLQRIDTAIAQLQEAQAALPSNVDYGKEIRELLKVAFELKDFIIPVASGGVPPFDPATIAPRVELLAQIGTTIGTATTELTNKIGDAHVELGFSITRAVIRLGNPSSSVYAIEASAAELAETLDRVSHYPDLGPDDRATIYVKARLDKVIWQVRIARDTHVLGKDRDAYRTLNRNITHAVGVWLNPGSTVAQVDAEIAGLHLALQDALAQVQ